MEKVFDILNEIAATSSRNEKENVLKRNKDSINLQKVLEYTYNPYKIYGIGKKTFSKKSKHNNEFENFFDLLDYLLVHNTGDEVTKQKVNAFINTQSEKYQEWYQRVVLKDIKAGITSTTINKIFPNLIPVFDVMLAKKYSDHEHKVKDNFIVTLKLDGIRVAITKENDNIAMMSRQGKIFEDFDELTEELKMLPNGFVYDGEFLLKNDDNLDSKDLYRETMKEVSKKGKKHSIEFNCFDIIPVNEFKQGKSKMKCIERKQYLHELLSGYEFKLIKEVPILYQGKDKAKIMELLENVVSKGLEGVMVNLDKSYECKRTDVILKVKSMQDCDLRIIGFENGEKGTKFENTLGRINVEYKGNIVGVGSGFSEKMRDEIWNNQDKYLGEIAKIQFFEESMNSKTKELSLRFPVFLEMRWDKDEPSMH